MDSQENKTIGIEQIAAKRNPFLDILAIVGVFLLTSVISGILGSVLFATGSVSKEFGIFLMYLTAMVATIIFGWWRYKHQGYVKPIFSFSFRRANFVLVMWGVLLVLATSTVLEPLLVFFPKEWMSVLINALGTKLNLWTALMTIVLAPLLEEILFRGVIQNIGVKNFGPLRGILLSAAIFGVIHLVPQQAINAFFIGIILGYIYFKTGSLVSVIAIHATNNLISYIFIINGYGEKTLADVVTNHTIYWIIYVLSSLVAVYSFYRLFKEIKNPNAERKQEL